MSLPVDDDDIAAWVARRLAALDTAPRDKFWRRKALGVPRSVAIASAPKRGHITFPIPTAEMAILRRRAEARGLSIQAYVRRALGTVMVACDNVDRDTIPMLTHDGLVAPR